jgi:hypothetical protein
MSKKDQYKKLYKLSKKVSTLEESLKKDLLYIAICLIPIVLLANEKSELRLIILPFFIFGMIKLVSLITSIPFVLEKYFPTKTYNKQTTLFEKIVYYFTSIYLIFSMMFMLLQGRTMENTIGESRLFWEYGGIGFCISIIILFFLKYLTPSIFNDFNRRLALWFCIPLGSLVLFPAIVCYTNRIANPVNIESTNYKVFNKFTTGKRNSKHKIKLITIYGEENFKIEKTFYNTINENEVIECISYKGNLGYEVIVKFNKI